MKTIAVLAALLLAPLAYADTWTGTDKLYHATAGYTIESAIELCARPYERNCDARKYALAGVILAGTGKELLDSMPGEGYTGFSYKDLTATVLGGLVSMGLNKLIWG